jgi:hypothetical protein
MFPMKGRVGGPIPDEKPLSVNFGDDNSPSGMVLIRWPYVKAYRTSTIAGNKTRSSSNNGSIVDRKY